MHPKKLSSKSMDMTTGSTWKLLLSFAVPLLIGNLFQQLYNTVVAKFRPPSVAP